MSKKEITSFLILITFYSCSTLQRSGNKVVTHPSVPEVISLKDTGKNKPVMVKPYSQVITDKAVTKKGLFTVHKVDTKYYFEIPDSLFDKDILVVNRIEKAATEQHGLFNLMGYGGDAIGTSVIQFCKGLNNKIFIRSFEYKGLRSTDSSDNGLYKSIVNSNVAPLTASFEVKAFSRDSTAVVIDMTDYISQDNQLFSFDQQWKSGSFGLGLGAFQSDRSFIKNIAAYPLNVEIKTVKTYANLRNNYSTFSAYLTYELNTSIVLLPANTMRPRYADDRVGYFATGYQDLDGSRLTEYSAKGTWMIKRWRLEPKENEIEKYQRGELVEPRKPIIFYIDPATPKKWVSYMIQGVNAWQAAFEQAGFKNAIFALEAPVNDSSWSMEDAQHNAIIYKASDVSNASGPEIDDPRTGEIIESHINWYHNIIRLVHDWYFVQASPSDTNARKMFYDDSLMGKLIRFVCSHEVGHTLGLRHNFGASSKYSVDSLRSRTWVAKNGITPSIMDYARFNYVAQPEDSINQDGLIASIGRYDKWAIQWGYRWLPPFKNQDEEKAYMNKWIIDKLEKDSTLIFGDETSPDVRNRSEDLGDNPIKAAYWGILNLKRITPHLIEWTKIPNENYQSLATIQNVLVSQFDRYLMRVAENVGGFSENTMTVEQKGTALRFLDRDQQKKAIKFLNQQLFITPTWLIDPTIFSYVGGNGYLQPVVLQKKVLEQLLSLGTINSLQHAHFMQPGNSYSPEELFNDLEDDIWNEISKSRPIDVYRRNLQKAYISELRLTQIKLNESINSVWGTMDILSIVKEHERKILQRINKALPSYRNEPSKQHLMDIRDRLISYLDITRNTTNVLTSGGNSNKIPTGIDLIPTPIQIYHNHTILNCWQPDPL